MELTLHWTTKPNKLLTSLVSLLFDLTDVLSVREATLLVLGTTSTETGISRLFGPLGLRLSSPLADTLPSPNNEVAFIDRRFWIRDDPDPGPVN